MRLVLLLTACLLALPGAEARADDDLQVPALTLPEPTLSPKTHNALIAAIEVPLINLTIWGFDRYVLDASYARISPSSIARNLSGGWTIDQDSFEVNQFGHPYQGALSFTAARSAGVGFWWSLLYPYFGSLMWELAMETDPPSINDQITTPLAGALLGEALHRLTTILLFSPQGSSLGREILATLLNPMRALNRHAFGLSSPDDHLAPPPYLGHFFVGLSASRNVAEADGAREDLMRIGRLLSVGVRLLHGIPGHTAFKPQKPLDHFDFEAELNVSTQPFGLLTVDGLLWGGAWGSAGRFRGMGGLYAMYDFSNPTPFRVSSAALGGGATLVWSVGEKGIVFLRGLGGAVPMGAAGLSASKDLDRDYHFGPGALTSVTAGVIVRGLGLVEISGRNTLLVGMLERKGWERVTRFRARVELSVAGCHGVGLRYARAMRQASFTDTDDYLLEQEGGLFRVYWVWRLGRGETCSSSLLG